MKKLVLLLAVAFTVSMFSCKKADTTVTEEVVTDSLTEEVVDTNACCGDTACADTLNVDTVVTPA